MVTSPPSTFPPKAARTAARRFLLFTNIPPALGVADAQPYYLLSDILPEDKQLRTKLQTNRLVSRSSFSTQVFSIVCHLVLIEPFPPPPPPPPLFRCSTEQDAGAADQGAL